MDTDGRRKVSFHSIFFVETEELNKFLFLSHFQEKYCQEKRSKPPKKYKLFPVTILFYILEVVFSYCFDAQDFVFVILFEHHVLFVLIFCRKLSLSLICLSIKTSTFTISQKAKVKISVLIKKVMHHCIKVMVYNVFRPIKLYNFTIQHTLWQHFSNMLLEVREFINASRNISNNNYYPVT